MLYVTDMSWCVRMLVGYSSSSEEEGEANTVNRNESSSPKCHEDEGGHDDCPVRKKPKTEEQLPKTRCVDEQSFVIASFDLYVAVRVLYHINNA